MLDNYGILGLLAIALHWLRTKICFPNARLIRFPIYIRGRHAIKFGSRLTTGRHVRLDAFPIGKVQEVLVIGDDVQLNDSVHIGAVELVEIGDHVLIASRVFISDHNHGRFDWPSITDGPNTPPADRPIHSKPVRIGNNVWIGESVCILPGVTIGDGAVIGAGSVVTRDIEPRSVAAGNPARTIRRWDEDTKSWARV